ncbi:actin cytoskeleton organization protein App1 [Cordyceps fumosorosea ARSEF 2679]|uniref:Actin cytoskeleton organization protein App1 n=1 Tax=Cordyceps fumosorosea (strain ARSEF 2679) TaxID=1081104 RepID=A0A167PBR5_CORFA|nr:actin cytoskeleton organization protein App1 [Cordyceps fumosorosea ARSEF 2679]OAA56499.1 actin cytoskeleton organization protein App1 [Cordyceps fumosorosea ARSEF 2679]
MPAFGSQAGATPTTAGDDAQPIYGERGYRRRKLAEMAGSLYRTGQQAVTDMRETYVQTRARMADTDTETRSHIHIPGAFPDAAITVQGDEHLVLFPSYAKRHTKRESSKLQAQNQMQEQDGPIRDEDYWRQEFERHEDERAIADVDVRGWMYNPQSGPIGRRNRILIGLARQLSGISAPRAEADSTDPAGDAPPSHHQLHEEQREQEKIDQEAANIERRGRLEKQIAGAGGYSEEPFGSTAVASESFYSRRSRRRGSQTPESAPTSPLFGPKQSNVNELSEAELTLANANLMARLAPFMTTPLIGLPVTVFFYNDSQSQSRTVLTDDAGHFNLRAALDFVPTHVRVLGNEDLSATQEVKIIEPRGVSLISDIDDTVKKSNIASGAREIFRNTFIRELRDLTIEGVQEWYTEMHAHGVMFHYCSNSPWQLFPVLASFFKLGGLPPGSLHLKQYSGMLQGIFEPVAERKKGTLTRLLRDFPDRKFLLVGDSGEADLEVYTDLAVANPGRILAIFIRDVTTTERPGYFDAAYDLTRKRFGSLAVDDGRPPPADGTSSSKPRQNSAPVVSPIEQRPSAGPAMGTLIDFAEEPEELKIDEAAPLAQVRSSKKPVSAVDLLGRKAPPPRPAKPAALRGATSATSHNADGRGLGIRAAGARNAGDAPPPKPPPRIKTTEPSFVAPNLSRRSSSKAASEMGDGTTAPSSPDIAPPLPRRRGPASLRNLSPRLFGHNRGLSFNSDVDDFDPLPPAANPLPAATGLSWYNHRSGSRSGVATPVSSGSPTIGAQGVNRKQDMWRRRVARAHEQLEQLGVALYTWRRGQDVSAEAMGIIKRVLEEGH